MTIGHGAVGQIEMSRRALLAGVVAMPFVASGCRTTSPLSAHEPGEFIVHHDGSDVRCLFHDRLVAGDRPGCLLIVLLHGASTDASQWFDIGLIDAVDQLRLGTSVHRVVAVAPDLADHDGASGFVIEALLPHVANRFAVGMHSISGISRGAAVALEVAREPASSMISLGLHSPAFRLRAPIEPVGWRCFVDVGSDDPLADEARHTSSVLRDSGVDVAEHLWPGRHDRPYWRRHLPEYLAFHADAAQRSAA